MGNSGFKGKQRGQVIQVVAPPFGQFHKQFTNRTIKTNCAMNGTARFNIYSCLETSDGQSFNLYLKYDHFFNARVN